MNIRSVIEAQDHKLAIVPQDVYKRQMVLIEGIKGGKSRVKIEPPVIMYK